VIFWGVDVSRSKFLSHLAPRLFVIFIHYCTTPWFRLMTDVLCDKNYLLVQTLNLAKYVNEMN